MAATGLSACTGVTGADVLSAALLAVLELVVCVVCLTGVFCTWVDDLRTFAFGVVTVRGITKDQNNITVVGFSADCLSRQDLKICLFESAQKQQK